MNMKARWNRFVQKNRNAAKLSVYEARALTNIYEACHGDFALLPDQYASDNSAYVKESAKSGFDSWKIAFAR